MQLVIEISDTLKKIADNEDAKTFLHIVWQALLMDAIKNGQPLPKGHGRLIDAEALDMKRIDYIVDGYAHDKDDCAEFGMMIILAATLIEADGDDDNG